MERMKTNLKPLFTDVTWGAGGSTADLSLQLALYAQQTGHVGEFLRLIQCCIFFVLGPFLYPKPDLYHDCYTALFHDNFSQYALDVHQHGKRR
jgi:5,10-methylenetetrahydrofolate reductase